MKKLLLMAGLAGMLCMFYSCGKEEQPVVPEEPPTEEPPEEEEPPVEEEPTSRIPVIYIETEGGKPIVSKEDYLKMNLRIESDNEEYCIKKTGFKDGIRGRGNATWDYPKKPYRIKFDKKTSLFGLEPAKSWVLLADYRSPTLLQNVIAFELGSRLGLPFTNHYRHVDLVLNDIHRGTYILTEQVQVGAGRVDIDEDAGFLVELDFHYDEDPRFRTAHYGLPVMIKSPEDLDDSGYGFVRDAINSLEAAMQAGTFPNSGYTDLIDVDNLVDFVLINDIVMNFELQMPASVYMYKGVGEKIRMGPLWDFDCGYGYEDDTFTFYNEYQGRTPNFWRRDGQAGQPFFRRFFEDPAFVAKYKARWNEKYAEIADIANFIERMYKELEESLDENSTLWRTKDYKTELNRLNTWWERRVAWLNGDINT
jgi:spore coat protein CotH